MMTLAIANLTHRKVRTILSVLAVAIAITLLLVLVGLSDGTLQDVSQRMASVDAEIVVRDKHFDLGSMSGGKLWEKEISAIEEIKIGTQLGVERVMPVFLGRMKAGGLSQNVFGVKPEDFGYFAGARKLLGGVAFADAETPEVALTRLANQANPEKEGTEPLPLIIDERLANAGNLALGERLSYGDTPAEIVGIIETGVAGRVFAPINFLRAANGVSAPTAHMFFVKANRRLDTAALMQLCEAIEQKTKRQATLVANYGQVLEENFRNLTIFMKLVSLIALVICFLFIVVTMYTIVLERGREIAIMQSLGADQWVILRQTIQESLLICLLGTVLGIALAYLVRWVIEMVQPLIIIHIQSPWLVTAMVVGIIGGVGSALFPGYLALRRDPVVTLSFE